jgi:hypothetical protein
MALETIALLNSLYYQSLGLTTVSQMQHALRAMMSKEQIAAVEKEFEDSKKEEQKQGG